MKVIGVNGIHVKREHNNNTDIMLDYISNNSHLTTYDLNHPERWAYKEYTKKYLTIDSKELLAVAHPDDIVFGHSRGCLVIHEACERGAKFKCIFLFGAAVDNDLEWPEGCSDCIINVFNPKDRVLWLGSLLPFHPFGTLGLYGYRGKKNKNILNLNADIVHSVKSGYNVHSDYFLPGNVEFWASKIITYADAWKE